MNDVYPLTTVAVARHALLPDSARHVVWCHGDVLAVCDDGTVCLATDDVHVRLRLDAPPTALSAGGGFAACGSLDGELVVLSTSSTASCMLGSSITAAATAGDAVVVAHGDLLTVMGVDATRDGRLRVGPSVDARIGAVTVLARVVGRMTVAGGAQGCSWFDSGLATLDDRHGLPTVVAAASDRHGHRVALGDLGGSIHLVRAGRAGTVELAGYPDRVGLLCWTADGRHLCAAAADEVTAWEPDTTDAPFDGEQDEPLRLVGHDEPITALAASPTDGLVASGDATGRVCVWAPGRVDTPVGSLSTDGTVLALAWSDDGRRLVISSSLGHLVTAEVRPGALA